MTRILTVDIENLAHLGYSYQTYDATLLKKGLVPGHIMCWAGKWLDEKRPLFASEFHHGYDEMIRQAWDVLDEADVVVHFNGQRHDIPHLNTAFLRARLGPPSNYRQIDLYRLMRNRFKLPFNGLDEVAQTLGVGEKLKHEGFQLWLDCLAGDPKAWARMRKYCIQDVVLAEGVYLEALPWIASHPHRGLIEGHSMACPSCGSTAIQKRGQVHVGTSAFQRYMCNVCRSWSRGTAVLARVETRSIA